MLSLSRFYSVLHHSLIKPFDGRSVYFYPFGSYDNIHNITDRFDQTEHFHIPHYFSRKQGFYHCYFFDQEPFYTSAEQFLGRINHPNNDFEGPNRFKILAVSERSDAVEEYVRKYQYFRWYYFFHGFAALDWYRDFQYVEPEFFNQYDKVFICYNNLISKYRSYRLHLVSNLISQDLIQHGSVSMQLSDADGTWRQEIEDPDSHLSNPARVKIFKTLRNVTEPLVIDTDRPHGALSADVQLDQLTSALWHVVTETVYYLPKLHLTEKVFKPIVARRPFLLAAAPGNLAYLKSYGFRTFDRWVDESYDTEPDHYIRIEKITAELARLCALGPTRLKQMHQEMQEVLEFNFNHFYGDFKRIIVDELIYNYEHILCRINNGRVPNNHSRHHQRYDLPAGRTDTLKQRLYR